MNIIAQRNDATVLRGLLWKQGRIYKQSFNFPCTMHLPTLHELRDLLVCSKGCCSLISWLTWLASELGLLLLLVLLVLVVLWAATVPMGCWRLMKEGVGWIRGGVWPNALSPRWWESNCWYATGVMGWGNVNDGLIGNGKGKEELELGFVQDIHMCKKTTTAGFPVPDSSN